MGSISSVKNSKQIKELLAEDSVVMLDVYDPSTAQFEQGRSVGLEEERSRITQGFDQKVSSSLIAALF
jgi:hypothetical protein